MKAAQKSTFVKRETIPASSILFGQVQEQSASEDQEEESEKESSPTSEHEARLFDLEKDLGPTLLKYPDISTCENPIREIKISHEMLSSFICFRDLTVKDFLKLNSTFPKSNFDRCIDLSTAGCKQSSTRRTYVSNFY